jgi:5-methylthioadenosine/S-adenosylhomocysteine deaminase
MTRNFSEINIVIGTDGPGSNNDLDMIEEMRLASVVAKGTNFLPTAVSAKEALYASTMGGAIAISRQYELGSIKGWEKS